MIHGLSTAAAFPAESALDDTLGPLLTTNLGPQELEVRQKTRAWATKHLAPVAAAHWEAASFPHDLVASFAELRIGGGTVYCDEELPRLSPMSLAMAAVELARVDASFATFFLVNCGLAMESIAACASEEQKARWLPKLARLESVGAFGLTEPNFGSDATSLETTARTVSGGFELRGEKRWIGNATHADLIVIWARHEDSGTIRAFVIETGFSQGKARPPGLRLEKIEHKTALRGTQNADIYLEGVFVPDANALPVVSDFRAGVGLPEVLESSRILVAWLPVGVLLGAYDLTLRYLRERSQFKAPLASFALVQEKVVRLAATIASSWLLVERVTLLHADASCSPPTSPAPSLAPRVRVGMPHVTMAKAWNTLRAREAVGLARELLGGNGIVGDFGVGRHFCDLEALFTYEGTYDINILVTGRFLTGFPAFKSPSGGDPPPSRL